MSADISVRGFADRRAVFHHTVIEKAIVALAGSGSCGSLPMMSKSTRTMLDGIRRPRRRPRHYLAIETGSTAWANAAGGHRVIDGSGNALGCLAASTIIEPGVTVDPDRQTVGYLSVRRRAVVIRARCTGPTGSTRAFDGKTIRTRSRRGS